ncbi:MAG: arginase family protein [Candidatus Eisenbacteria bacterium]
MESRSPSGRRPRLRDRGGAGRLAGARSRGSRSADRPRQRARQPPQRLGRAIGGSLARPGKIVAVVGGDHPKSGWARDYDRARASGDRIFHLDAHADLRDAYMGLTHRTPIFLGYNVMEEPAVAKLVQVGLRDLSNAEARTITESDGRIVAYFDSDLQNRLLGGEPWGAIVDEIVGMLPRTVYLSFDIDGLDPALCPNTGTPVPGGLGFSQVLRLLRAVAESGRKIVGLDLCEVSPGPGGDSEWDANVGARLLYKMIGFTLLTHAH